MPAAIEATICAVIRPQLADHLFHLLRLDRQHDDVAGLTMASIRWRRDAEALRQALQGLRLGSMTWILPPSVTLPARAADECGRHIAAADETDVQLFSCS